MALIGPAAAALPDDVTGPSFADVEAELGVAAGVEPGRESGDAPPTFGVVGEALAAGISGSARRAGRVWLASCRPGASTGAFDPPGRLDSERTSAPPRIPTEPATRIRTQGGLRNRGPRRRIRWETSDRSRLMLEFTNT